MKNKLLAIILVMLGFATSKVLDGDCTFLIFTIIIAIILLKEKRNVVS